MARLRSPIVYIGGKGNLIPKLLPLIPAHHTYVEVFGGGATMLCAKEPALVEVYNDLDESVVNLFRVLRDPLQCAELYKLLSLTPYSRQEFTEAIALSEQDLSPVAKAWRLFLLSRQSFSGRREDWGYSRKDSRRGMAGTNSCWCFAIEQLTALCQRWSKVQIENQDWRKILARYDTPETFFYLDPPYVLGTCTEVDYQHILSDDDHRELIEAVQSLKGKVLLSGYNNPIYEGLTWKRLDWQTAAHSVVATRSSGISGEGSRKARSPRVESVWMNYEL